MTLENFQQKTHNMNRTPSYSCNSNEKEQEKQINKKEKGRSKFLSFLFSDKESEQQFFNFLRRKFLSF